MPDSEGTLICLVLPTTRDIRVFVGPQAFGTAVLRFESSSLYPHLILADSSTWVLSHVGSCDSIIRILVAQVDVEPLLIRKPEQRFRSPAR